MADRAQHLIADDLGKAQHRVQRGFQLMAHGGQEGGLHLVGDLGLAQRGAQGAVLLEFLGDVLDRAFIAEQRAGPVAHGAGIFRNPDAAARTVMDFRHEMRHHVIGLHQGAEFVAALGFDIQLGADVGEAGDQRFGRGIAVDVGQRLVDRQIMAFRRGAENAFHRVIEKGAITGLAGGDALARIFRHPLQQRQDEAQHRQDDQAGDKLAAQMGDHAQADHQPRDEGGKAGSKVGGATLSGIFHRILEGPHAGQTLVQASIQRLGNAKT